MKGTILVVDDDRQMVKTLYGGPAAAWLGEDGGCLQRRGGDPRDAGAAGSTPC